ncbi:MAG: hypothetical protein MK193_00080 [Lentisphaeria bacterium]|nr:hypothetical protein [Lentisphaeria bacterium]
MKKLLIYNLWILLLLPVKAEEFFFAPVVEHSQTSEGENYRALGPFLEGEKTPEGHYFWGFRPFYSKLEIPQENKVRTDVLWPLWSKTRTGNKEFSRRLGGGFSSNSDVTDPNSPYRKHSFPFWFSERTDEGETHRALFPFYGTILKFGKYEQIDFTLFPIYLKTTDSHPHEYYRYWIWPFFGNLSGEQVSGWRAWPIYGTSTRENDWQKSYFLWPFFSWKKSTRPRIPGSGWSFWPIYGKTQSKDNLTGSEETSSMFLWPFFRFDEKPKEKRTYAPWPFYQIHTGFSGPESVKKYYWPFYGWKETEKEQYKFVLWPIYTAKNQDRLLDKRQSKSVLLIYNQIATQEKDSNTETSYVRLWPIFSKQSNTKGFFSFRFLDFSPSRDIPALERNWVPIWTLFSIEEDENFKHKELLWGLWQSHYEKKKEVYSNRVFLLYDFEKKSQENSFNFQLFKGLLGFGKKKGKRTFKLLWIPFSWESSDESKVDN